MARFLEALFAGAPAPSDPPIDAALAGGARAASLGGAFVAGYQAALRALVPDLPRDVVVALCATEEGGGHPRAIATRLEPAGDGFLLSGKKQWVTGGTRADLLLVVASTGLDAEGRNRLRVARVRPDAPGVAIEALPPAPFVPDVPHARVSFEGVPLAAADLLPGDGYERYLKPFRTIEDLHVHAAVLAHVLALGLAAGWPREALAEGAALLAASRALAQEDPLAPTTHVALAGLLGLARSLLERTREQRAHLDAAQGAALERDLALLEVAGRARALRTDAAWRALGCAPEGVPGTCASGER